MKNVFFLASMIFLITLISCKKDDPFIAHLEANQDMVWEDFNKMGPILEEVISHLVEQDVFTYQLVTMTNERPTGDFEVLFKDFLNAELLDGGSPRQMILDNPHINISSEKLERFIVQYPSTIIAVRGNIRSWAEKKEVPAVKFIPSNFDEKSKTTNALKTGAQIQLDLSKPFADAVVTISKSERHDLQGNLITPSNAAKGSDSKLPNGPSINGKDVGGEPMLKVLCEPEPTACPSGSIVINSFTATPVAGAVRMDYNIDGLSPSLCTWSRIKIVRTSPTGQTYSWLRYANQPNFFFDNTGIFNTPYNYQIFAYVAYMTPTGWVTCPQSNTLSATATYPAAGPVVSSYRGSNQTSTSIRYDWSPTNASMYAEEYRIQRATPTGYQTLVSGLDGNQSDYFYQPVPSNLRGTKIETRIQYRGGGYWQGNFFDRTYASFRDPGQPLMYYGININDITDYEWNESPLYGAPEIRLVALQSNAAEESVTLANAFLPMSACTTEEVVRIPIVYIFGMPVAYRDVTIFTNSGFYFPTNAPNGYTILSGWNADLFSSAISIKTTETDVHVPLITEQTNVDKVEVGLKANYGFKAEIPEVGELSAGVESSWKNENTTTVKILYPTTDLSVGEYIIYYHEHMVTKKGIELFGFIPEMEKCVRLNQHLGGE